MSVNVPPEEYAALKAGLFTCHYCPSVATNWDHIVPRCIGGSDCLINLQPSCFPCNQAKADRMPELDCCAKCQRAVIFYRKNLSRRRQAELVERLTTRITTDSAMLATVMATVLGEAA